MKLTPEHFLNAAQAGEYDFYVQPDETLAEAAAREAANRIEAHEKAIALEAAIAEARRLRAVRHG